MTEPRPVELSPEGPHYFDNGIWRPYYRLDTDARLKVERCVCSPEFDLRARYDVAQERLAAAERVCEAAERFERKTKISLRMGGYQYSSADISPLRTALAAWCLLDEAEGG